jgi:deoxyinosine 3'endonuclease (endonuclease V)
MYAVRDVVVVRGSGVAQPPRLPVELHMALVSGKLGVWLQRNHR